jgi:hypothetical protein
VKYFVRERIRLRQIRKPLIASSPGARPAKHQRVLIGNPLKVLKFSGTTVSMICVSALVFRISVACFLV